MGKRAVSGIELERAELIDERPDERLDCRRLDPYLRARLPGAEGPLSVRQFGGGKANLTYLLRFGPLPNPPPLAGEGSVEAPVGFSAG